jgi:hypothetical protein
MITSEEKELGRRFALGSLTLRQGNQLIKIKRKENYVL